MPLRGLRQGSLGVASVFVRVDLLCSGHHNDQWPESVQNLYGLALGGEHLREASIYVGTLIRATAPQNHVFLTEPHLHHLQSHLSRSQMTLPDLRWRFPAAAVRLMTRPAPCTVL